MNPSVAGKEYPLTPFTIESERVAAFRNLFGEEHGVPVTFVSAAEFTVMPLIVADPELDLDLSRVLHGNQEYEIVRPLVEGETVQVRSRIESIRARGGSSFLVIATDLVDDEGEVACRARSTMIERSSG